jgi:hypothetical protein
MNTDILDKPIVLSLNRAWQVIGHRTVKQALIALNGGGAGLPAALGLDIAYPKRGDGAWDFDRPLYLNPLPWDDWVKLPVRDFDFSIATPKLHVRVPTVIVSTQFNRMPLRIPRVTRQAIFERDRGVCQYTGEFVGKNGGNLDHVVPRDRGGRDSFENLVWSKKGDQFAQGQPTPARSRPAAHAHTVRAQTAPGFGHRARGAPSGLAALPAKLIPAARHIPPRCSSAFALRAAAGQAAT